PGTFPIAPGDSLRIPGVGELRLGGAAREPSSPLPGFRVAFPRPGMRCRLAGRAAKPLRQVLAEAGVPAWLRDRVPLLLRGDELLAVAACGAAEGHAPAQEGESLLFCWIPDGAQGEAAPPGVAFLA
ncbi:MAG: tRNA lysidine(34) synthetase TilS, partial [Gammaproteobacteria bacterium]